MESTTLTDVSDFIEHVLYARVTPYVMDYEGKQVSIAALQPPTLFWWAEWAVGMFHIPR